MSDRKMEKVSLLQCGEMVKEDSELLSTVCPSKISLQGSSKWAGIVIPPEELTATPSLTSCSLSPCVGSCRAEEVFEEAREVSDDGREVFHSYAFVNSQV